MHTQSQRSSVQMNMSYIKNCEFHVKKSSGRAESSEREGMEGMEDDTDQRLGEQRYQAPSDGLRKHKGRSSVMENNK